MCPNIRCDGTAGNRVPLTDFELDHALVLLVLAVAVCGLILYRRLMRRESTLPKKSEGHTEMYAQDIVSGIPAVLYLYAAMYGATVAPAYGTFTDANSDYTGGESVVYFVRSYEALLVYAVIAVYYTRTKRVNVHVVLALVVAASFLVAQYVILLAASKTEYQRHWELGCDRRQTRLGEHVINSCIGYAFTRGALTRVAPSA
jgi:Mn2+/Fe2+ NRAMP family transporter